MQAQLRKPYGNANVATAGHLTPRDHHTVEKLKKTPWGLI